MSQKSLLIVVLGYIVRGPMGGMAWHYLQYALGLARLGHDVYFLEDSDDYPGCYDPSRHVVDVDPNYGLAFAAHAFERLGLAERWAYYDAHTRRWCGPAGSRALGICAGADVVLNISGSNPLRDWLKLVPIRILVDTDPAFSQIRNLQDQARRERTLDHNVFFSFGENIGTSAALPDDGLPWRPTRQPVVLDCWPMSAGPKNGKFTTVLQWDSYRPAQYDGRVFGMKSMSFGPYRDLPARAPVGFELAVSTAPRRLTELGWGLRNPLEVTKDPWTYQSFIMQSKAEFGIAKHGYVVSRCGWFSERSACYLACGRPVLAQDTGFTRWLPDGDGVVAFNNLEEALIGVEDINARYEIHCSRARQIVEAYFDSDLVLDQLISAAHQAPLPVKNA